MKFFDEVDEIFAETCMARKFSSFLYYPSDDGRIGILNHHNSLLLGINFAKNNLFMRRFRAAKKIRIRTPIIYMTRNKITRQRSTQVENLS